MKARATLGVAAAVNAALLLGCTALQNLQGTNTNKPATPAGSPTATATPIGAGIAKRVNEGFETAKSGTKARIGEESAIWAARGKAAQNAIDAITPAQERAVGQAAALNIIQQSGGLVLEERLVQYVNGVANAVGSKGARKPSPNGNVRLKARRFFVGILNDPGMNAYGLPGGYILLTRGLVENLTCESDLAWILGHEIAHVDNEDGLKALKLAVGGREFLSQLRGGGEKEATLDDEDFFARVADKMANITYAAGLDKDEELAADLLGLEYAMKSGYDSRAPKRVLELLATNAKKVRAFASHDTPQRRLEVLGARVEKQPNGKLGIERFDEGAVQRLEATKLGAPGTSPGAP